MNTTNSDERYSRHYLLKGFGREGQDKLSKAKVLVVGAGGLGCPALQYLAAAGVGTIGIADEDVISLSNLQRQILYSTNDIGQPKAVVAAERLKLLNPEIAIHVHLLKVSTSNALELFLDYDVVIDGTDNFAARYLINDACALLKKPLVFGAVYQYQGQVAIFNVPNENGVSTNYRHIFSEQPGSDEVADCSVAGVLGVLPGIIGVMQATETIKLITGIGEPLVNKLLTYNGLNCQFYTLNIPAEEIKNGVMPLNEMEFKLFSYQHDCSADTQWPKMIDAIAFQSMRSHNNITVIDVRNADELPRAGFNNIAIPLAEIVQRSNEIVTEEVIVFCQSGARSLQAAKLLTAHFGTRKTIYSLQGGISSLPGKLLVL